MMARGSRGVAPLILNLGARSCWLVNIMPLPLYPRRATTVTIEKAEREASAPVWNFRRRKVSYPCRGSNTGQSTPYPVSWLYTFQINCAPADLKGHTLCEKGETTLNGPLMVQWPYGEDLWHRPNSVRETSRDGNEAIFSTNLINREDEGDEGTCSKFWIRTNQRPFLSHYIASCGGGGHREAVFVSSFLQFQEL